LRVENLREFGILSVAGAASMLPLLLLPAMIGVLVDESGLSEAFAGVCASANFAGGATSAMLLAFRMHHIDLRKATTLALLVAAAMDALSAFSADREVVFLLARFASGLATGAAYTCIASAFARYPDADRGYGLFVTLQFVVSGIGLYALPVHASALGTEGMFLSIAGLELLALLLMRHLPGKAIELDTGLPGALERSVLLAPATILAVLSFGIFEAANNAPFTYLERLGASIALTQRQLGVALLISSLAGIPGAFVTIAVSQRFGRTGPLALGVALSIVGLGLLMTAKGFAPYLIGTSCLGFTWAFCLPFIQGLMASLDRNGSAVAAGASASTIGDAAGPGLAAWIVGNGQYRGVFSAAIALIAFAWLGFFVSSRRARRAALQA
jgi:predicted MFS family arabinose efflux permease